MFSSSSSQEGYTGTPTFRDAAQMLNENLLPETYEKYNTAYNKFINWKHKKKADTFSENVLLEYFGEIANSAKPTSMWAHYSMLKTTLKTKNCIDINQYIKLKDFLRHKSAGYVAKKAKTLEAEHVEKFINEAPDDTYLATKVALVLGMTGGLFIHELSDMTITDITDHGDLYLVKIPRPKNKVPKTFVVAGEYYKIIKKYIGLRSQCISKQFFQQILDGKCTGQVLSRHKIANMARDIAKFLNLDNADSYTGRFFCGTPALLLRDAGDLSTSKRQRDNKAKSISNKRHKYFKFQPLCPTMNFKQLNNMSSENNVVLNLIDNSNCHITLNLN